MDNSLNDEVKKALADARAAADLARAQVADMAIRLAEIEDEFGGAPATDGEMWLLQPHMGNSGGGGGGLEGFQIYTANHAVFYVSMEDAMDGYDPTPAGAAHENWSLEFKVASSKLSNKSTTAPLNPVGTSAMGTGSGAASTERYNGDAGADPDPIAQTYYRIPIIRGGKRVGQGGAYRENIFCAGSRGPIVELVRI